MRAPIITQKRARQLRRATTRPEALLWAMLKDRFTGLRFRRQHPIGPYILDFYCAPIKLCVEVDGPVHDDPKQVEHDKRRDAWLVQHGVRVLRFSAEDVETGSAKVLASIQSVAAPSTASRRSPSPVLRTGEDPD